METYNDKARENIRKTKISDACIKKKQTLTIPELKQKLILDREEKFFLASPLSAIKIIVPGTQIPSFIKIPIAVVEILRQRTHVGKNVRTNPLRPF
jgi:hypothetical protein